MMQTNPFKEKLMSHQLCSVALASWHDGAIEEMCGWAGFDSFLLDCEHGCVGYGAIVDYVRTCEAAGIVPMLKIGRIDPSEIQRYLDAGIMGLCISNIRTREEAEKAVRAMKYAPLGERGISTVRAGRYGIGTTQCDFLAAANKNTALLLMVENRDAVENLEEILSVPGVDSITVGTTDLSADLGHPGDKDHPEVAAAIQKVLDCAKRHHVPVGTALRAGGSVRDEYAKGFTAITCAIPAVLIDGLRAFVDEVKTVES